MATCDVVIATEDVTDTVLATVLGFMGMFLWLAAIGFLLVMLTRAKKIEFDEGLKYCEDEAAFRRNVAGIQREWWRHRHGCQAWFTAERDTCTNEVLSIEVPSSK